MQTDGTSFWDRIDQLLALTKSNLTDMCIQLQISYGSVNTQRTRHSIPKIEQLLDMARYFDISVESLLGVEEKAVGNRHTKGVSQIADACMRASEQQLSAVRLILRLDER